MLHHILLIHLTPIEKDLTTQKLHLVDKSRQEHIIYHSFITIYLEPL